MGVFDTYRNNGFEEEYVEVQIKINATQEYYRIGDQSPLEDGIYLAPDGAVVICDGRVVTITKRLFDKWGNALNPDELVGRNNPVLLAISELEK